MEEIKENKKMKRNENIVEEVRKFVEEECNRPTSKYGHEPYENHFVWVVKYAKKLAKELNADEELIEIAAWLHDIGSILYGRDNHHITGADIAEKKLNELNYPLEKIKLVKKCILNHRGSREDKRESVEERIIAEADSLAQFDNLEGIFMAAFLYENKNQKEARKTTLKKINNEWNQLSDKGKDLVRDKWKAINLLLK
jgi:uncharacterized protein